MRTDDHGELTVVDQHDRDVAAVVVVDYAGQNVEPMLDSEAGSRSHTTVVARRYSRGNSSWNHTTGTRLNDVSSESIEIESNGSV